MLCVAGDGSRRRRMASNRNEVIEMQACCRSSHDTADRTPPPPPPNPPRCDAFRLKRPFSRIHRSNLGVVHVGAVMIRIVPSGRIWFVNSTTAASPDRFDPKPVVLQYRHYCARKLAALNDPEARPQHPKVESSHI